MAVAGTGGGMWVGVEGVDGCNLLDAAHFVPNSS